MPEFRKLATDVYAFLQPPLIWYSSAGVIVGDRDVIVVDSLTSAAMTQALLSEIRRVTDKPVRFLINTHSHVDHVYTNHLFPEATVISTHPAREHTEANRKAQGQHEALFARLFPDVDFRGGRYTLQDMTFSGSLTFHQGEREVRVIELGVGGGLQDSLRMLILYSYCELAGEVPESAEPARQNHMTLLQGIATEAKLVLEGTGPG
jgi:glyoxylase-like metal-dependent hydrolase (beta-lactamase superfamily II)